MTALSQARASMPSLVDFDPRHEVILLCSSTERGEAAAVAETLLALGFDALVLSGTPPEIAAELEGHGQGARPALLVATDASTVEPVLRSRLARVLSRPHCWLEGVPGGGSRELQHRISARLDALERERATETSCEDVVVDEVSNVILLPVAPTLAPTPPQRVGPRPQVKRPSRTQLILWPLAGAALAAAGFFAAGGTNSEAVVPAPVPPPAPGPAAISPPAAGEVEDTEPTPLAAAPAPVAVVQPAALASAPVSPPATPAQRDPLADVLDNERVIATDELYVYEAPVRARDWYEAMNVCRGRSHAGMDGWATPSSKQLHALARARVLPEGSLWSRTRALRSQDVAFVVHGRAGTVRRAIKTETIDSAVCVRRRSPSK